MGSQKLKWTVEALKGVAYNKSIRKNMLRHALNAVRQDLKKDGCQFYGVKQKTWINKYFEKYDIELSGKPFETKLVEMWMDPECELMGPVMERNYTSFQWNTLCKKVYSIYGKQCMCCGSMERSSVDHIKPYSKYKELSLDLDNMQVLCMVCNARKSNRHEKDYRTQSHLEALNKYKTKATS